MRTLPLSFQQPLYSHSGGASPQDAVSVLDGTEKSIPAQVSPQQQKRLNSYKITDAYFFKTTMARYKTAEQVGIAVSGCLVSLFTMGYGGGASALLSSVPSFFSVASLTGLLTASAYIIGITAVSTVGIIGVGCGMRWLMLALRGDLDRCDAELAQHESRYQGIQEGTDPASQLLDQSFAYAAYIDEGVQNLNDRKAERAYLDRRMRENYREIKQQETALKPEDEERLPHLRPAAAYFAKSRYLSGPAAEVMRHRGMQANNREQALNWVSAEQQAEEFEAAEFDDEHTALIQTSLDEQTGGLYSAYRKEDHYRTHLYTHRHYQTYAGRNARNRAHAMADRDHLEPQSRFGHLRIWWRKVLE